MSSGKERPVSPYHKPGFYAEALAKGRHRDIVGGRWEETGLIQMQLLLHAGLEPQHHFLDIGAGSLRLGCRLVPYLRPGHYWATDLSGDLLRRGYEMEIADKSRLSPDHLIEDANFDFPGLPDTITHALAFAVFTHLPLGHLAHGLTRIRACFPHLDWLMFTVFTVPDDGFARPHRQPDGVVTHPDRAPWHHRLSDVLATARAAGFDPEPRETELPRGQLLIRATPMGGR
ncbi:class I SAM-dependent methyltransferase [Tabrizicola oligotrophica]|uniref:Class I SAM-dependent methyltransferase n=1 Tax=Tabrizicola oligotrophica TaxID=2710650 RepID=A0A6M0QSG4_9RHOB|nr:class I SAM-dependent methyltransferase [Tabrizicola oligotrophica]NEY90395.1 class I SAM-dependent methyltransferase [Tabrizicola oligotrophica]